MTSLPSPDETKAAAALFAAALDHHRAGRLAEAESAYRQILATNDRHAEAVHLLGVISLQRGSNDVAAATIFRAIEIDRSVAEFYSNLAAACINLDRPEAAFAASSRAVCLRPEFAEAHSNRGNALKDLGRPVMALASCAAALVIRPDFAEACNNRGNALLDLDRADEALAAFDTALAIKPDFAEALGNRANALRKLKRPTEALAACGRALCVKPALAQVCNTCGNALGDLRRSTEAITALNAAICWRPAYAEAHNSRGNALMNLRKAGEALVAFDSALAVRPDFAEALSNRAGVLNELGRPDQAIAACNVAIATKPDFSEAYLNRGNALRDLGRLQAAVAAYASALNLRPSYAEAHYNQAFAFFLLQDLDAGWPKYEWRWRGGSKDLKPRIFDRPEWQGEPIAGRSLLLHAEQGMGDTIQFSRFAALVAGLGAHVVLEAPARLLRLLSNLAGVNRLVAAGSTLPAFDMHCPLMTLPGRLGTTVDTVPAPVSYLRAEAPLVRAWQERLGSGGFKIGIAWQGNPDAPVERGRSAPLSCFAPLARLPGVRLISLQKVHGLDQLDQISPGFQVETLGADFDAGPDAFIDTAAVMMCLDLVITVDTAIGHLAGALGRPTWIALQAVPHWVWMLGRDDSPWYPSARLFRQISRGDWGNVFSRMVRELAGVVRCDAAADP